MVGSINPPTTGNTHDNFVAAAKAIGSNEVADSQDTTAVTGGVNGIATAAPSNTAGTAAKGSGATQKVAGAGVALVAVALVALVV